MTCLWFPYSCEFLCKRLYKCVRIVCGLCVCRLHMENMLVWGPLFSCSLTEWYFPYPPSASREMLWPLGSPARKHAVQGDPRSLFGLSRGAWGRLILSFPSFSSALGNNLLICLNNFLLCYFGKTKLTHVDVSLQMSHIYQKANNLCTVNQH